VTVGVCVTVGAEVRAGPEPAVELELTGLEWVTTGLATCVDTRVGALACT
jgi:hypothetical protein